LPIIFIVINNNGIGFGMDKESFDIARRDTDPMLRFVLACSGLLYLLLKPKSKILV